MVGMSEKKKDTAGTATGENGNSSKKVGNNYSKIIIGCVVVAILLVGTILIAKVMRGGGEEAPPVTQKVTGEQVDGQPVVDDTATAVEPVTAETNVDRPWLSESTGEESAVPTATPLPLEGGAGIKDISQDTVKSNTTPVVADKFVSDLKGNSVAENYDIAGIHTVTDFISFKKKRAVTGKGVELYWLDATYKGVPAKVQVPFSIFKELDETGITVVDVEVVEIDAGDGKLHEIATNFTVRRDYKELLQQAE